jgi:IQ calmodulin-binding motif
MLEVRVFARTVIYSKSMNICKQAVCFFMRTKQPFHFLITLFSSAVLLFSCNKNDTTAMTSGYKPIDGGTLGQNNSDKHNPPSGCFFCCSSSALNAVVDTSAAPSRPIPASKHIEKISTKDTSTTAENSLTPTTATEVDFPIQEAPNAASTTVHLQKEARSKQEAERKAAIKIQTVVRGHNAKSRLAALRDKEIRNKQAVERKAAIQIQAVVREHNAKSQLAALREKEMRSKQAAERKAAIQIQAVVREHNAKSQLAALREKEMRSKQAAERKAAIQIQAFARRNNADRRLAVLKEKAEVEVFSTPPKKSSPLSAVVGIQTTPPIIGKYKVIQSQDEQSTSAQSAPIGRYKTVRTQSQDEQSTGAQSAPIGRYKTVRIQDQNEQGTSAQDTLIGRCEALQSQGERGVSAQSAPMGGRSSTTRQSRGEQSVSPQSVPVRGSYAARQRVSNGAEENVLDTSYDSSIASTESFGFLKEIKKVEFSGIKKVNKRNAGAGDSAEYYARRHPTDEHGRPSARAGSAKSASPVVGHRATAGQDKQVMSTRSAPTGDYATRRNQVDGHAQGESDILAQYIELRVQAKSQITGVLQDSTNAALLSTSLGLSSDSEDDSNSSFASAEVQSTDEESTTGSISEPRLLGVQEIPESTARTTDGSEESNSSESTDDGGIMEEEYKLLRN